MKGSGSDNNCKRVLAPALWAQGWRLSLSMLISRLFLDRRSSQGPGKLSRERPKLDLQSSASTELARGECPVAPSARPYAAT